MTESTPALFPFLLFVISSTSVQVPVVSIATLLFPVGGSVAAVSAVAAFGVVVVVSTAVSTGRS